MSRKLIAMAICLALLLSSFLAKAGNDDINMDEIAKIQSDDPALMALYDETVEELKNIIRQTKTPTADERPKLNLRLKVQLNSRVQQVSEKLHLLLKEKRINPMDLAIEDSAYSLAYKALSGMTVLSNIQMNESGQTSPTDCSHKKQALEARNHLKTSPNNLISGPDILVETVRTYICGAQ